MKKGNRIFYKGDFSNLEGYGEIVKVYNNMVDIHLNDGRKFERVYNIAFDESIGQRFFLINQKQGVA